LIARQRANLKRTFIQAELPAVEARVMPRLARIERELSAATAQFSEGYEAKFGPLPCLHEARDAMDAAARALADENARDGRTLEATALADLIKARQNLRKLLSLGSSQASECRAFDNEQSQMLRRPLKKDGEQEKERLAQLEQDIADLAKQERKFSEEIGSSSGGVRLEQNDHDKREPPKPSLAQRQDAAAKNAQELEELMNRDDALTELSRERMQAAARSIQFSAQAMHAGRKSEAGKQAFEAAEQLERLARQVAALKPPDLANRLAGTQSLAQELAGQEQKLADQMQAADSEPRKAGSGYVDQRAKAQQGLTEEGLTLSDLFQRNLADAAESEPELAQALREAAEQNPPREITEQMRRAAHALRAGRTGQAGRDVAEAARRLAALAQQLESTRHAFTQPQLEKFLAAERQAAQTQQALNSVANEQQKALAEKKMTDLRETMNALKAGDDALADATQALAQATQQGGNQWISSVGPTPRGKYRSPVIHGDAVLRTMQALQSRIQELILKDALLDKDEAVPPQYKKYVEEYYRTLSEDLRK
jgi:hypothetical protein